MRLLSVRLQDFLAHRDSLVRLDKPVTVLQGHNGAGKSSVRDAIHFALTGRARSTDRGGKGAGGLIRSGCSEAVVTLEACPGAKPEPGTVQVVQRSVTSKGTDLRVTMNDTAFRAAAAGARITDLLGSLPVDMVEAVLDSPAILLMDGARRSACLAAALDVRLSVPQLRELALAEGVSLSATESIVLGVQRFAPPAREGTQADAKFITAEVLGQVYARAYEKRTEVNAELRKLRQKLEGVPRPPEPAAGAEAMARAEAGLQELEQRLAGLRAAHQQAMAASATHTSLTQLLARVRGEATATVQLPLTAAPVPPLDPAITERLAGRRASEADLRAELVEATATADGLEAEVARLKARSATCPSVCSPRPCAYLQADLDAMPPGLVDEKTTAWEEASARVSRLQGELVDLQELLEQDQQLVEHHHRLEAQAAAQNRGQQAQATRTEADILEQLNAVEHAPQQLDASAEAVAISEARLAEIRHGMEATRAAAQAVTRWDEQTAAARQVEQDAEVLDDAVKALAPGKLPAAAARHAGGPMLDRVNAMLPQLMGGRHFQLTVTVGKAGLDLVPQVRDAGGPLVSLPLENLSTSEQLRLGVAIGAALASITGLGFILVDQLELLMGDNRGALVDELISYAEAGHLQNVIILSSADRPTAQDDETVRAYWVDGGTVRPAGQAEVAQVSV